MNPAHPASVGYMTVLRGTAQKLGVKLHLQEVRDPGQFDSAFATIVAALAQALVVAFCGDPGGKAPMKQQAAPASSPWALRLMVKLPIAA